MDFTLSEFIELLSDLKELLSVKTKKTGYKKYLNKNIFVRTITHHYVGHVTEVTDTTMMLDQASWIPDDGRFHDAMKNMKNFQEVEPYVKPVTISLSAILDCTEAIGDLPTEKK